MRFEGGIDDIPGNRDTTVLLIEGPVTHQNPRKDLKRNRTTTTNMAAMIIKQKMLTL